MEGRVTAHVVAQMHIRGNNESRELLLSERLAVRTRAAAILVGCTSDRIDDLAEPKPLHLRL